MHALHAPDAPDAPTVGAIKRALYDLTFSPAAQSAASLREANETLRQLAQRNGVDPDEALRRSLAAVQMLRDRLVLAHPASEPPPR